MSEKVKLRLESMKHIYKDIIEQYIYAYNAFDVEGMCEHLDADIVFENISNGDINLTTRGIEEFREQVEAATTYFTEREQRITAWDIQDQQVLVEIAYAGILAIELPNGLTAGDTLNLTGQSIFEFQDGKIIHIQDIS